MAWRIHDSVLRGEIDNRKRNHVQGTLWLCGQAEPIRLDLRGNAAPDLAGCLLKFENLNQVVPLREGKHLAPVQRGSIGDLTASRKVRILELPTVEAYLRRKKGLPVPEHLANCVYLEWFSEADGRVVVESSDYRLTISAPEWRLTPEEEEQRKRAAAAGFAQFLEHLGESIAGKHPPPAGDKEWDEFDYEQFMRESDARTDKYSELLDKYLNHPDRDRIIAREMGWTWLEDALAEMSPLSDPAASIDQAEDRPHDRDLSTHIDNEPDLDPDPATEGVDWVRRKDGQVCHPLSLRAFEGCQRLQRQFSQWHVDLVAHVELKALLSEYQVTSAKLAGALDGLAFGRDLSDPAFVVACLKRALHHLHAALSALDQTGPEHLIPRDTENALRGEFFTLREEILRLMREFRGS